MLQIIFEYLDRIDNFVWSYVCFPAIIVTGLYFSLASGFVQVRKFPQIVKTFFGFLVRGGKDASQAASGVHPLKASFACIGASVGIGNIVSIITAIEIGGPGALVWIWATAIVGSLVKYAEVCLGMRFRVPGSQGGTGAFLGGPMYYLEKAFSSWAVKLFCFLMCLYGAEILQFNVVVTTLSMNFDLPKLPIALTLIGLIVLAEAGGVNRVGAICSAIIPVFIVLYLFMGFYVLAAHAQAVPGLLSLIFTNAFSPAAAVGGFAGSTLMTTISQGIRRSCYSSDIGVGYASIIHSESREKIPAKQASLTIFEVFLDIFVICTMSVVLVLATGVWADGTGSVGLVQKALSQHFPYMHVFMPLFLFMLGYTTIITYFCAGMKAACFLFPNMGKTFYYAYGISAFLFFTYRDFTHATILMSLVLAVLLILNISAMWKLRKYVQYNIEEPQSIPVEASIQSA